MKDYEKLKELLEKQEKFPTGFTVKFIGRNTDRFKVSVLQFEARFPSLQKQAARESSQGAHLALTYVFVAQDADHIVTVLKATGEIEDVMIVL